MGWIRTFWKRRWDAHSTDEQFLQSGEVSMSTNKHKYDHPKIMLVDVGSETVQRLRQEGYAVAEASLGTPYLVPRDGDLHPLIGRPTLPYDYKEQEILIIDLHYDPISVEDYTGINVPRNVDTWWVSHEQGMVNPRLLYGKSIRDDLDRILNSGGVVVIFADSLETQELQFGHIYGQRHFRSEAREVGNNWGFLSITSYVNSINLGNDHGSMMQLHEELPKNSILSQILSRHLDQARYACTIMPGYATHESWMPILINKFNVPVSGAFLPTVCDNLKVGHCRKF